MSRFYGSIQGNRGEATRQGSKDSGIEGIKRIYKPIWNTKTEGFFEVC